MLIDQNYWQLSKSCIPNHLLMFDFPINEVKKFICFGWCYLHFSTILSKKESFFPSEFLNLGNKFNDPSI